MKIRGAGASGTSCRDGKREEAERSYIIEWEFKKAGDNEISEILMNAKERGEYID
jgi:hypothetical protein